MYDFNIVGHRGAPMQEPENTLASFRRAIDMGVDWIEFDLREIRDGVLVVIHDDTVDRTTSGQGKVSDMTFEEIERLDAGHGQKVPSLQQVIDLARNKVKMDMEIKQPGIEADVVSAIVKNNVVGQCMISSFMLDALEKVKKLSSDIMTAAIMEKMPENAEACMDHLLHDVRADAVMISIKIASVPFVGELRRNAFKIGIWNADTPDQIEKYAAMRPYFLCSNYPDRLLELREAPTA
jgi:glycerophosphoryl diester phosphodiesterase